LRADLQRLKRDTSSGHSVALPSTSSTAALLSTPPAGTSTVVGEVPREITHSDTQVAVGLLKRHKKAVLTAITALAVTMAGLGFGAYRWLAGRSASSIDSLAVLPFTNVTGDPNTDYLSDGLTESLISSLSELPNLAVRPRNSAFHYKSAEVDPQKAASELKVEAVVTGRVTQRGDSLLVSAELIDARSNRSLWSDRYDRKLSDAVAVQQEIAGEISSRLRERLTGAQKAKLSKGGTTDPEAYQLYLKGRYNWDKRTPESLKRSKEYFEQAIAKDPSYALAYLGLAEYYGVVSDYLPISYSETVPNASEYAKKALELDDSLAEAHAVLGIGYDQDWKWLEAEKEYQRALELDPNSSRNRVLYAYHLDYLGKFQESLMQYQRAVELDPLNMNARFNLAAEYMSTREFDKTIDLTKKLLEIDTGYSIAHCLLGGAYMLKGNYESWLGEFENCGKLNNDREALARAEAARKGYDKSGFHGALQQLIGVQEEQAKRIYVDPEAIAGNYALLGEKDQTFAALEKAFQEKSGKIAGIKGDPAFDSLHSDPRYASLLKRMGLPE
jgi:TolB-like protein/Tfp pilus assembly protein PilF